MVGCKFYERGRGRIRLWSRIKVLFSQKQALLRGLNKYSPGNWLEKAMNNSRFEGRGSSSILIVLPPVTRVTQIIHNRGARLQWMAQG